MSNDVGPDYCEVCLKRWVECGCEFQAARRMSYGFRIRGRIDADQLIGLFNTALQVSWGREFDTAYTLARRLYRWRF